MAGEAGPLVELAPDLGTLAPGTLIAHNYRVKTQLGAGGMGTVFLAENVTLQQEVVVKILRVGGRGAGAEEARVLASLDHPNVVHVYAYDDRYDCIVMQRLKGASLQKAAFPRTVDENDASPGLDLISSLRVAAQTGLALSAVHERGVVHRDVKPDNVMVEITAGEVKWVKLIDFGSALRVGRTIDPPSGTVEFCPPEQFDRTIPAAAANDIYALGVTIFYLCTGRYPFDGTPDQVAQMHLSERPPELSDVVTASRGELDPHLSFAIEKVGELVASMMLKDLARRPTARDVAFTLNQILDNFSSQNTQVGRAPSAPLLLTEVASKSRSTMVLAKRAAAPTSEVIRAAIPAVSGRSRQLMAGAGVGLLVLIGVLVWALWPAPPPVPVVVEPPVAVAVKPDPPPVEVKKPVDPPEDPLDALPKIAAVDAGVAVVKVLPVKKDPRTVVQIEAPDCEPDADWKRSARANLQELSDRASKSSDTDFLLQIANQEEQLSKAINSATTRGECGVIEKQMAAFLKTVQKKAGGK